MNFMSELESNLITAKNRMLSAKAKFEMSFMKSFWLVIASIAGIVFSILAMFGAAAERHMTIQEMLSKHIYGGEWMVIIATICCIIYTTMMIWDSVVLHRTYVAKANRYRKYRKIMRTTATTNDENLFNFNEVEVC